MFKFKSYDDVDKVEALISRNRIDIDEVDRYSGFNRNQKTQILFHLNQQDQYLNLERS